MGLPVHSVVTPRHFTPMSQPASSLLRSDARTMRPNPVPTATMTARFFTPMSKEEEEQEKVRVAALTPFQKDQELRKYNREIARYSMLRGINNGELYTWSGKYKALARDYGFPLIAWYWACWSVSCAATFGAIHVAGVDAMVVVAQIEYQTGFDIASKVDPEVGKIGLAVVLNELLEPIRLPVVIMTVKPVMDQFFPPKF